MEARLPTSVIGLNTRAVSRSPQAGHTAFWSRSARLVMISNVSPHTALLTARYRTGGRCRPVCQAIIHCGYGT